MSAKKALFSKKFFMANLLILGLVTGFLISIISFSCSTRIPVGEKVLAEDTPVSDSDSFVALESLQSSFRAVSQRVLPVVVKIETVDIREVDPNGGDRNNPWRFFFDFDDGFDSYPDDEREREPFRDQGMGSGVIISKDGNKIFVLTNAHVAGSADEILVTLYDGREFTGSLIGSDERKDLAVVAFESDDQDIPVAVLGDSESLYVGDWVLAIGNPYGFDSSVTAGIVSALHRRGGPGNNINDFIQTDASINQGNSGGALVNIRGEVVGINTWITTPTGGSVGLGFSIPINNAKKTVQMFIENGEVEYGWLGVSIGDLQKDIASDMGISLRGGAFIYHVFKDSPAFSGGIQPGDVITKVGSTTVLDRDHLVYLVGDLTPGEKVDFTLMRSGKVVKTTVTITARKKDNEIDQAEQNKRLWPGLNVVPITEEVKRAYRLDDELEGVFVNNIESGSPAAIAGLKQGDIITSINDKKITSLLEFYTNLNDKNSKEIRFKFIRDDIELSIGIMK